MRKLVAALACRNTGSRLYGKPMQNLVNGKTILEQIIELLATRPEISTLVLGISEGVENKVFVDVAKAYDIPYVIGDEIDVLGRLIDCAELVSATDVFRITTECPFIYLEPLVEAWHRHVKNGNDVTATDELPEGVHFEIFTLSSLKTSHRKGKDHHRSEMCSRYIRENWQDFKIEVILPEHELRRTDLRLTVDYPEDLALCRRVYENFLDLAPDIPLKKVIHFLDENPEVKSLVVSYTKPQPLWSVPGMTSFNLYKHNQKTK